MPRVPPNYECAALHDVYHVLGFISGCFQFFNHFSHLQNPISDNFVFANISSELVIEATNMQKLKNNNK